MVSKPFLFGDNSIFGGIILIIAGIILLLLASLPLLIIQIMIVLFPIALALWAGYEMYGKNSGRLTEAFLYSSGAAILAASVELIVVFFILRYIDKMDVYCTLMSNFQGLELPIAIFGLAVSTISGIESSVSIRNDLSKIKTHLGINDFK